MQGRLSRPVPGRIQTFPWASWELEFERAGELGFQTIEWLFESERHESNPIWTDAGRRRVRQVADASGVAVRSVCADYFMAHPFFRTPATSRAASIDVLTTLIAGASEIGARTVLVPVLEEAEVRTPQERAELIDSLRSPLAAATAGGMRIGLETELEAGSYRDLVEEAGDPALGVYYDTGNAAAKGFDPVSDLRLFGPHLCGVHLKDRSPGGPTVPLGRGSVNFAGVLEVLGQAGYGGPVIIQSTAGDDFEAAARAHLAVVTAARDTGLARSP